MQSSLGRHLWNTLISGESVRVGDEMKRKKTNDTELAMAGGQDRLLAERRFKCGVSKMKWSSQEESFTHENNCVGLSVNCCSITRVSPKSECCILVSTLTEAERERMPTSCQFETLCANQRTDESI